jgi:predicted RNA-binding Zn-ribbon protein involved in translation (DUF1610 family)
MSMHLFSTPVECTHCGTVVDDPQVDHCPTCGELLRERRTPARLAGVERKHTNVRFLMGTLRFLGVIAAIVGLLVFLFGSPEDGTTLPVRVLILVATIVLAVAIFAVAAFVDVVLDVEENTRASFRINRQILEHMEAVAPSPGRRPAEAPSPPAGSP